MGTVRSPPLLDHHFNLSFNENGDIWILPIDSTGGVDPGKPVPFIQTSANEYGGSFSPDGRWMTYISNESGRREAYVVAFPKPEGMRQVSIGGGAGSIFSRDGKELFFGRDSLVFVVDVKAGATFDCSVPRKLLTNPRNVSMQGTSSDGAAFLARINHAIQDSVAHLDVVTDWFEVVKSKFAARQN